MHDYLIGGQGNPEVRKHFLQLSQEVDRSFQNAARGPFGLGEERALIQAAQEEWVRGKGAGENLLHVSRSLREASAVHGMDRLDAHILAHFADAVRPEPRPLPDDRIGELRSLARDAGW